MQGPGSGVVKNRTKQKGYCKISFTHSDTDEIIILGPPRSLYFYFFRHSACSTSSPEREKIRRNNGGSGIHSQSDSEPLFASLQHDAFFQSQSLLSICKLKSLI